jgi:hypothetical protein
VSPVLNSDEASKKCVNWGSRGDVASQLVCVLCRTPSLDCCPSPTRPTRLGHVLPTVCTVGVLESWGGYAGPPPTRWRAGTVCRPVPQCYTIHSCSTLRMDEQGSCSAPISEVDFRELYYSQAGGYEQVWQAPGAHSPALLAPMHCERHPVNGCRTASCERHPVNV